jgi:hypothetical protein
VLLANASDSEQGPFRMILVAEYEVCHFRDGTGFVWSSIDIEYWDRPGQFTGGEVVSLDIVSVNEVSSGSGIDQGVYGLDLRCVCSFNADFELQGLGLVLCRLVFGSPVN